MLNFAHFNPKKTHISTSKKVQIYTTALQMNNNHAYMHGYYSCANDFFFILFFSLPYQTTSLPLCLQQPTASPTSTTTQHGRIRRKKKITTEPPNPQPPPNTAPSTEN